MRQGGPYGEPGRCRARSARTPMEVAMQLHPELVAQLAAEHVRDMRAVAAGARRARQARRARRGGVPGAAALDTTARGRPAPRGGLPPRLRLLSRRGPLS